MSTGEFPEVHAAYMKYVTQLSIEPTNPTQLIKYAKQANIQGLNWSNCSKYFKILNGQSTSNTSKHITKSRKYSNEVKKSRHHKTTSGPILFNANNLNKSNTFPNLHSRPITKTHSKPLTNTHNTHNHSNHKRTHSAVTAETHHNNEVKNEKKITPFQTIKMDELFTELKDSEENEENEEEQILPVINTTTDEQTQQMNGNGNGNSVKTENKPISSVKSVKEEIKPKKRHVLLDKPWNKNKSSTWPRNRMPMSYDLKKWLIDNKFEKFSDKLYKYGIESKNDLKLLKNGEMIEDLCGKHNIQMTIIYRRKFIQKVLSYNKTAKVSKKKGATKNGFGHTLYDTIEEHKELYNESDMSGRKRAFKYEMEAIDALTKDIKQTAQNIKATKQLQLSVANNMKLVRESVSKDFDELVRQIALRRKVILSTLDRQSKIVNDRLSEEHRNICNVAKTLIIAQQSAVKQIRESEPSEKRREGVIGLIESTFEECEKYKSDNGSVDKVEFKYENGDVGMLKNYAKLIFNDEQLV